MTLIKKSLNVVTISTSGITIGAVESAIRDLKNDLGVSDELEIEILYDSIGNAYNLTVRQPQIPAITPDPI